MSLRLNAFAALLLALLAAASLPLPPATAGSPVQYFERQVASDTAGDYESNGALDIVGVHIAERYQYDSANRSGREIVQFRIELRERDHIKNLPPDRSDGGSVTLTPIEYTLGFTAGGKAFTQAVTLTQTCAVAPPPGGAGLDCNKSPPSVPAPHFTTKDGGVVVVFDRANASLPIGTAISKVWAVSATITQGQKAYQDAAPKDNQQGAEGPALVEPTTPATGYPLQGTFPFITMRLTTESLRYVVAGGTASFVLEFRTHTKLVGIDHAFVDFQAPTGWTFEGNLGTDFITTGGDQVIEYEFAAKAPAYAKSGDKATVAVRAALQSAGGFQTTTVNLQVAGAKVDAPEYVFELLPGGSFKAESPSSLRWRILHNGAPLAHFGVAADFLLNGKTVDAKLPATEVEPGVYEVVYSFTSGGQWTADVYVSELEPSPHKEFTLNVGSADGGLLPGAGILGVLGTLAAAAWRRRL